VAAADATAAELNLYAGMPLAQAQALVPGLAILPAEPKADAEALRHLAAWCLRYTPLAAVDPPDGVWLDIAGCAHLHGSEIRLLRDIVGRWEGQGVATRAAVADTPGAAHAVARFDRAPLSRKTGLSYETDRQKVRVVPPLETSTALSPLPIEALRLPPDITASLRLLGFETVAQLAATPRNPLVRRFGLRVATRLDQALGTVFEPIMPLVPPDVPQTCLTFIEPLLTAEAFAAAIAALIRMLCADLEKAHQGARRLDLLLQRVDGSVQYLRVGTSRPSRDARHLARLLNEKLEQIDPDLGVEAMRLVALLTDPLPCEQTIVTLPKTRDSNADISTLVDRLENRLGTKRVWRATPVESAVPERSVHRLPAAAPPRRADWPADLPRPVRLLAPPQPVDVIALLPDEPPVAFIWRRVRHRVRRADGPERIAGEWWKRAGEMRAVRDYFRVEDETGQRFWLFRRGDGNDPTTGDLRWFLQGFF
jgi:protein ImuB